MRLQASRLKSAVYITGWAVLDLPFADRRCGLEFNVLGFGFRFSGPGFRVQGLGPGVWDLLLS